MMRMACVRSTSRPLAPRSFLAVSLFLCAALVGADANEPPELSTEALSRTVARLLSHDVPAITIAELSAAVSLDSTDRPIILDARELAEYEVSRIPGSMFAGFKTFDLADLDLPQEAPIVVYCSVGYRSEEIARRLLDAGYRNVFNLYGGLFEWFNRGLPVVDADGTTTRIHGYSRRWSRYIEGGEVVR